ncbi:MAG: ribosome-binding factor A [Patescibacteria group bacterium]|nr:ribosome-binding factor A [Patescibacteria group bacterium]
MTLRREKLQEALREAAAEFLAREANRQSLITVTGAVVSEDGKRGNILITVCPDSQEKAAADFANRNRRAFTEFFKTRVRGASPPRVEFVIDRGEKNRQRLDELSN